MVLLPLSLERDIQLSNRCDILNNLLWSTIFNPSCCLQIGTFDWNPYTTRIKFIFSNYEHCFNMWSLKHMLTKFSVYSPIISLWNYNFSVRIYIQLLAEYFLFKILFSFWWQQHSVSEILFLFLERYICGEFAFGS